MSNLRNKTLAVSLISLAFALSSCGTKDSPRVPAMRTLVEKDFKADLPAGKTWLPAKASHIELRSGGETPTPVMFDLKVIEDDKHSGFFLESLSISEQKGDGQADSVQFGNPVNRGTEEKVLMQIPVLITWSYSNVKGQKSRTIAYRVSADGTVKEDLG
jgi:hypothetical protein